ncbi:tudor domain-containing protein 7A isoform X1 [Myripristis murdjan]|nr:tudor domain-containing protein 7 isoform X1 [Myripristis murdjan]
MSYEESIKKMLRSVLQSSKGGVSVTRLQSDYMSLCGEGIPVRKLGYTTLEEYLRSIPSVVRMEYRMGQLTCFAAVCKETAHIAELVAKQRTSKKPGHSQLVNCRMRPKPSNPYMRNVKPRSSLRQPSLGSSSSWPMNRPRPHVSYGGFSASGDFRQLDQKLSSITPLQHRGPSTSPAKKLPAAQVDRNSLTNYQKPSVRPPALVSQPKPSQCGVYDQEQIQGRLTQLLTKYCSGLWLSKLPGVYKDMFNQHLDVQALTDLAKWTSICSVEKASGTNRTDCLVYPPLPPKPFPVSTTSTSNTTAGSPTIPSTVTTPKISSGATAPKPSSSDVYKSPLAKPTFIFPPPPVNNSTGKPASSVTLHSPTLNPAVAPRTISSVTLAARFSIPPNNSPRLPTDHNASSSLSFQASPTHECKSDHSLPTSPSKLPLNLNTQTPIPTCILPAATTTTPPSTLLLTNHSASSPFSDSTVLPSSPPHIPPSNFSFSPSTSNPAPAAPSSPSAVNVSADVRQKLTELLSKYSNGLWVHALPKLFMDTYKTPFPEHILDNLHLLLDICNVEHPLPDKKKAILYKSNMPDMGSNTVSQESQPCRSLPSGVKVLSSVVPPLLVLPSDQYPSVLVTDALNSNTVTVRYVGENYSNAQEAMEDAMCSFYSQSSVDHQRLHSPAIGQLAAVRGEEGDELARVQIIDVMTSNKVKVYYVDYGFSAETSLTSLLELHQNFLSLPFQATSVRLAGLELHSSHPSVLSTLDSLAIGKILLMETLEPCNHNETSVVVLYDTSQDDDVNINSACLKALQDKTMDNPLTVNTTYQDVCVTNVCSDGLIYCQLPSRGTAKLSKLLDKTEAFFISQVTSDSLVSRPFGGKLCLARYKGRWSRVEITSLHGRVVDILFIDLGIPASVEVTELREMPPPLLNDFLVIPPQAIRCRLADLSVPAGDWSPHAILWLKEAVLGSEDCRMKVLKLDLEKADKLVHMYLFTGADSQELDKSINHQLSKSELWQKLAEQNNNTISNNNLDTGNLSALVEKLSLNSSTVNPVLPSSTAGMCVAGEPAAPIKTTAPLTKPLPLPPPLDLPQPGQNMDVFVPVACHPGHFVIQPWQDVHKLVVLMGEMILYYNKMESTTTATQIQKGEIYAAKVDKNWHRVLVKGILSNRLVSVYKLDHGKHELVSSTQLRPLIEEFRQLPFQAISAQLAGVGQRQWSEEVSMIFREHVENRGLVAQVESVLDSSEGKADLWERRLTVYLVDTNHEDRDIWIHNIMLDVAGELSSDT